MSQMQQLRLNERVLVMLSHDLRSALGDVLGRAQGQSLPAPERLFAPRMLVRALSRDTPVVVGPAGAGKLLVARLLASEPHRAWLETSAPDARVELVQANVFELFEAFPTRRGDLIYLDPPYDPVSKTASFTSYTSQPFGQLEQARLARLFGKLSASGARVVLSNSDTPLIRNLYRDFRVEQVWTNRTINSNTRKRGKVAEVLISA
jgi:hypothetical protein